VHRPGGFNGANFCVLAGNFSTKSDKKTRVAKEAGRKQDVGLCPQPIFFL
jgi:hypothetical protein